MKKRTWYGWVFTILLGWFVLTFMGVAIISELLGQTLQSIIIYFSFGYWVNPLGKCNIINW